MDWSKTNWTKEDIEFSPKRQVNNRRSKFMHHNIGWLYSPKMKREVGYESLWGECLFYYFLELDPLTVRYYEQPVNILMKFLNQDYLLDVWNHVPDVLVFRQGDKPHLFQVKGTSKQDKQKFHQTSLESQRYASIRNWNYSVVYPKDVPEEIKSNILFLWNYIKPRRNYEIMIPEILNKLQHFEEKSIIELAKGFTAKIDYRFILPAIYHLICTGQVKTDLKCNITEQSLVRVGSVSIEIFQLFEVEGHQWRLLD